MATFRVGQRVRRVRNAFNQMPLNIPIGAEVIVTGGAESVVWDGRDMEVKWNGVLYDANSCNYELIQPERNQVVTWESLNLPFDPRKIGEVT